MMTTIATQETSVRETNSNMEGLAGYRSVRAESEAEHADVLVQLKANLAQLEDVHARLQFMMGELSYLLRKS